MECSAISDKQTKKENYQHVTHTITDLHLLNWPVKHTKAPKTD